jgi:hypothetical protein
MRYKREIIKIFAQLSIGLVLCFLAVGAFSEVLVQSNKADTAVYTTAISYVLESSKGLDVPLRHFESLMTGVWKGLNKLVENMIR